MKNHVIDRLITPLGRWEVGLELVKEIVYKSNDEGIKTYEVHFYRHTLDYIEVTSSECIVGIKIKEE